MTEDEVLNICPQMVSCGFDMDGSWSAWNGTAYPRSQKEPEHWTDEFDYMLVADIDDGIEDNLPVFLALMMKGGKVLAITKYEPTAG